MMTGVILAGGRASRMKQPKALLTFEGRTFLERQVDEMTAVCDELVVVANEPKPMLRVLDRSVRLLSDFYRDAGPLGGMHAAFTLSKHSYVWVVACDMPFVSGAAARVLLEALQTKDWDAAIPTIRGGWFPFHGVYRQETAHSIQLVLDKGDRSMSSLFQALVWGELTDRDFAAKGIDTRFVQAIKTPADYAELIALPGHAAL